MEEARKEANYTTNDLMSEAEELHDLRQRCKKLECQNANLQKQVEKQAVELNEFKRNCQLNHGVKQETKLEPYDQNSNIVLR